MKSLSTVKRIILIALLAGGGYTIGAVLSPVDSTAVTPWWLDMCDNDICQKLEADDPYIDSVCLPQMIDGLHYSCDAVWGDSGMTCKTDVCA